MQKHLFPKNENLLKLGNRCFIGGVTNERRMYNL